MSEPTTTSHRASALTAQQQRAVITRQASVVLASGAGCGKTHVLTERYLSHLREDRAEVGEIVAITFTDRAAREMRGRIRKAITKHLRETASDDEANTWARHLRALETAPISTIHAFCGALLRQHALDAALDPRFDVLEDVLSVNLETEALQSCLQRLLTAQTEAGEDLRQLVLLFGWRVVVDALEQLLPAWDGLRWQQWTATPVEEIVASWRLQATTELLPRYLVFVLGARPKIARCLSLLRRFPPLPGDMADKVRFVEDQVARLGAATDLALVVEQVRKAAQVGKVGAKAWPDQDVYETIKKALKDFREDSIWDRLIALGQDGDGLEESVIVGRRFLRVAGEAVAAYQELKRQHGVVDFQDLLLLTRDLLRDHAPVRERLRQRYRFLLIDELQDTDPVQMELVEYLCGDGKTTGKLFTVGDHNQSIYKFRGADVHLFQGLRREVPDEGRQGLTVNFRSQPALLHFTNALLGHRLSDYEPLVAFQPQINPQPCVEFLWSDRPEKCSATAARVLEAKALAQRIAAMIAGEKLVVERTNEGAKLRPVKAGDVVLLFRAMTNVQLVEAALREAGLDYYLVGGRAFFAQQEIYDLLNLLRALENPQDGLSLAGTLRSPFCCVSDEALFVLSRHPSGLWAGLLAEESAARLPADQREPVARARRLLPQWRALKDRVPIARLLGQVFADSGYDAATQFEFLAERKLANLWKLLDLARTFDRSGLFGLAEFIARLGDLVRNQPREEQAATQPENADVVRLMTIHQAKGLEFPVVIVPDVSSATGGSAQPAARWDRRFGCVVRPPADEEAKPFADFAWTLWEARNELEDWQEDLRTLYVACTRARDYLILSATLNESVLQNNAWMLTLTERFDPASGVCLAPEIAEAERPRVHVVRTENLPVPPSPRPARTATWTPLPPLRAITELPPRRSGGIVTVADIEKMLCRRNAPLYAVPEVEALNESQTPAERLLRAVLRRWDFAEGQTANILLDEELQRAGLIAAAPLRNEVAAMLHHFAVTETCRELATAALCLREVEYELHLEDVTTLVRGVLDLAWQDAAGMWHLLALTMSGRTTAECEACWQERLVGVTLAATALQRQMGTGPKTVRLWCAPSGEVLRRMGSRLPYGRVLAEVVKGISSQGPLSEPKGESNFTPLRKTSGST
jgi:ATP-dependent helicase/nuclease subunit A